MDKLKEDTVSADRKERIVFDPDAWRKKDKSGRKTSAITSRQNFDNEKFTRKNEQEKVDEAAVTKIKTNSPQIEFVTGTDKPKEQAVGNQQNLGIKKIAEGLIKKAVQQVSEGKMGEKAAGDLDFNAKVKKDDSVPFDGPYTKSPSTVVDKSGARHTAYSLVRSLARQAMNKQVKEEIEQVEEAKKANTAAARAELAKRPVKPLTGKDAEAKKKESDDAWERLMAHAASLKKEEVTMPAKKPFRPANPAPTGSKSDSPGFQDYLKKRREQKAAATPAVKEEVEHIEERVTTDKDGNKSSGNIHNVLKKHAVDAKASWHAKYPDANDHEKALIDHGLGHIVHNLRNPGSAAMKSAPIKPAVKEETSLEEGSPIFHAIRQNTLDTAVNHGRRREDQSEAGHKRHLDTMDRLHQNFNHRLDHEQKRREAETHDHAERLKIARNQLKKKPASDPHLDAMHAVIRNRVKKYKWGDAVKKEEVDLQLEYEIHHDGNGNYRDDEGNEWSGKSGPHNSSFGRRKTITSNVPHAVHINGKKWKTFGSQSHAQNVANKIKGATVHKEETELTQEETDMSKTYADFIQQLQEYNAGKDGVYRHKGTYGGSYDSNDDEDEDTPKKPAAPAVKRGRGRPAGSKSGANQKVTKGKSYGGIATHTLSLPNTK